MLAGQHWRLRQGRRGYRYPDPDNRGRRNIATWGNEDTVFFFFFNSWMSGSREGFKISFEVFDISKPQ